MPQERRAAIYLRVSSEEQTYENQRPDVKRLARARGYKIVATYEEQASAVKTRPEYTRRRQPLRGCAPESRSGMGWHSGDAPRGSPPRVHRTGMQTASPWV